MWRGMGEVSLPNGWFPVMNLGRRGCLDGLNGGVGGDGDTSAESGNMGKRAQQRLRRGRVPAILKA